MSAHSGEEAEFAQQRTELQEEDNALREKLRGAEAQVEASALEVARLSHEVEALQAERDRAIGKEEKMEGQARAENLYSLTPARPMN